MKYFFTAALILLAANVFAQDTIYYDETGKLIADKSLASEYKIVEHKGNSDTATVRTYFISGKIQSEENYSYYSQKIREGKTTWWNEDGQKIFEANYKEGKLDGERLIDGKHESEYKEAVKQGKDSVFENKGDRIFTVVEIMPKYPGGEKKLFKFLQKNIKYPKAAREKGIIGREYVTFVVDKEGNVTNVKVIRGVSPELDAEAIRVVKLMPKWKPGYTDGKPVSVQYNLPINFTLH